MLCDFALLIKTNQAIYKNKNYILEKKTCFHGRFEFFKEDSFIKKSVEQSRNKSGLFIKPRIQERGKECEECGELGECSLGLR